MAEMLRDHGFQVATATDPAEALSTARSFNPEIAILDVGLPGMDGYQRGSELRRLLDRGQQSLRLITLSGYGRHVDHQKSAAEGFECHLVKPVELAHLLGKLMTSPNGTKQPVIVFDSWATCVFRSNARPPRSLL